MPNDLAPMLVMIVGIVTAGGVFVLRPLSKRLAELLHAIAQDRIAGRTAPDTQRLQETIASLEQRLSLLEERQNFTESLLDRRLPPPEPGLKGLSSVEGARRLQ